MYVDRCEVELGDQNLADLGFGLVLLNHAAYAVAHGLDLIAMLP
jgi:hypothetical protein